jgi:hypothetical protein
LPWHTEHGRYAGLTLRTKAKFIVFDLYFEFYFSISFGNTNKMVFSDFPAESPNSTNSTQRVRLEQLPMLTWKQDPADEAKAKKSDEF